MPAVMEAIDRMTADEKIQTMEYLWSQIESSDAGFVPPPWHGQDLARREALYQAGKVPVYSWSDVKARLEARCAAR